MEVLYNFNTSNVFIYHMAEWTGYPPEDNFNTSNVFIYPKCMRYAYEQIFYFNTSNVFIYHDPAKKIMTGSYKFQYI